VTDEPQSEAKRTGFLELFCDLVYVDAVTQVTSLISIDPTPRGFLRAALMFGIVWWAWSAYAWMANVVAVEALGVRIVLVTASAASFIMAFALPGAFTITSDARWFATALFAVRIWQIAAHYTGVRGRPHLERAVL